MRPNTAEDVFKLLDGYAIAAALGAAMELGLFWLLADNPMPARNIAQGLNIPFNRCQNWLQLLCQLGLLENSDRGYGPTAAAREAILEALSHETWSFLASSGRLATPAIRDLAVSISQPVSTWELQQLEPPDYLKQIKEDADYAARFTRMLYEIHLPLAAQLAKLLDLQGITRMMDLGGGSGVISHALLRRHSGLTSVVVDHAHVCAVGREIARELNLEDRISYLAADFVQDELPSGFDLVMLCDVGQQDEGVLRKIHDALTQSGRLVIVDKFAGDTDTAVPSRLVWALLGSMESPAETCNFRTIGQMESRLQRAGFRNLTTRPVPSENQLRWNSDWTILEASK